MRLAIFAHGDVFVPLRLERVCSPHVFLWSMFCSSYSKRTAQWPRVRPLQRVQLVPPKLSCTICHSKSMLSS